MPPPPPLYETLLSQLYNHVYAIAVCEGESVEPVVCVCRAAVSLCALCALCLVNADVYANTIQNGSNLV